MLFSENCPLAKKVELMGGKACGYIYNVLSAAKREWSLELCGEEKTVYCTALL